MNLNEKNLRCTNYGLHFVFPKISISSFDLKINNTGYSSTKNRLKIGRRKLVKNGFIIEYSLNVLLTVYTSDQKGNSEESKRPIRYKSYDNHFHRSSDCISGIFVVLNVLTKNFYIRLLISIDK